MALPMLTEETYMAVIVQPWATIPLYGGWFATACLRAIANPDVLLCLPSPPSLQWLKHLLLSPTMSALLLWCLIAIMNRLPLHTALLHWPFLDCFAAVNLSADCCRLYGKLLY